VNIDAGERALVGKKGWDVLRGCIAERGNRLSEGG
jgi:hypothetical protein